MFLTHYCNHIQIQNIHMGDSLYGLLSTTTHHKQQLLGPLHVF